jgi:polygalacturonase
MWGSDSDLGLDLAPDRAIYSSGELDVTIKLLRSPGLKPWAFSCDVYPYPQNLWTFSFVRGFCPLGGTNRDIVSSGGVVPPSKSWSYIKRSRNRAILEALEDRRLFSIPLPTIPAGTFLVTTYGAVGDGTTNNTTAIQNALNAAKTAGGGTVEIPAASAPYECGPITVFSNTNLQVESGATLQMLPYNTYPGSPYTSGSTSNFITYNNDTNVELSGSGDIDGQGSAWWTAYNANNSVDRPRLIEISNCNTVFLQNVNLTNAPTFNVAFGSTNNVTINGLNINEPASSPNTDGIDPTGSNYLIENCTISNGDDNIAIKPQTAPCSNITITGCTFGTGHGLSVGGETNDGLNGLTVTDCTFNGTTSGIRLKAERGSGGLVQNLSYSNITMTNVEYPININSYYPNTIPSNSEYTDPAQTVNSLTPIWQNISFTNITSTTTSSQSNYSGSYCAILWGLPEEPINGVSFTNVQISAHLGVDLDHTRNISFDSLTKFTAASGGDLIGDSATSTPLDDVTTLAGFTDQDIGSPGLMGSSLYDPDAKTWTNKGGGAGLLATSDQFNFASTALAGDGSILADVTSAAPQSGVMIRESTSGTAAFAAAMLTSSSGVLFEWRAADGATLQSVAVAGKTAPLYVEVTREGSSFLAYYSSNGTAWTQIGTAQTINMNSSALAGLAVSSANNSTTSSATFTNVGVTLAPVTSLTFIQQPSNVLAGTDISPAIIVEAQDAYGTVVPNAPITLSVANGPSSILGGTVTLNTSSAGTAMFSTITLATPGIYTLVAADGAVESTASSPFTVTANVTWTGSGDGVNWNNAANWSNDLVPNQYENVTVPSGVSSLTIGTGAYQVLSLNSASPITLNGGSLMLLSNSVLSGAPIIENGGALDVGNATLFVDYSAGNDPISTIQSYLASGYAGGAWNGSGIISSAVAAENLSQSALIYSVGSADGADGVVTGLSSGQIEIMPTLAGDAKLQGIVVFGDFQLLSQYFGQSVGWDEGNFTYGSTVDFGDFQLLSQNFGQTASLNAESGGSGGIAPAVATASRGAASTPESIALQAVDDSSNTGIDLSTEFDLADDPKLI